MPVGKKIAAIVLLLIYFISIPGTREVIKLPLLAEHYYDHSSESKSPGVFSFLVMHYVTEDGTDSDSKEDSELPFKSAYSIASFSSASFTPPSFIEILWLSRNMGTPHFRAVYNPFLPSQYLNAIWQPPRLC